MRHGLLAVILTAVAACGGDDEQFTIDAGGDEADASTSIDSAVSDPDAGPGEREVVIRFTPQVGDEPFACGTTYSALGAESSDVSPQDFRIYVHDVRLIAADGTETPVALTQDGLWQYQDVVLLDFEDFTGHCTDGTVETNSEIRGVVPQGDYDGLVFRVGIPSELNHADLIDMPPPLNLTGLWWGWNFGHIFLALVTWTEVTTPEPGVNSHYFHLGSIDCAGDPEMGETVTCGRPNKPIIRLESFDVDADVVIADFAAPLEHSNLSTEIGCHSFSQDPCVWPFEYVGLNWVTGSETPTTQRLFRVE
jgi:uncharacterized repeat protein (TIGR04052 family)